MRLTFSVPPVGTVTVFLHAESASAYDVLKAAGEVSRLKELDHLGVIRFAWEGAHHPRWEYVAFVLALLDRCRDLPGVHLSHGVTLSTTTTISSASELLKCWAMLLNVGHLVWTFAAEKALLVELWKYRPARQDFLDLFKDDAELQQWVYSVLKNGRYYEFYRALAIARIPVLAHLAKASDSVIDQLYTILRAYVLGLKGEPRVLHLRSLYDNLRRAAYLSLDSYYTPSALSADSRHLFTDPTAMTRILLWQTSGQQDPLDPLERFLYREVYLSEPVLKAIAEREAGLRRLIRRELRTTGPLETIEGLATGRLQDEVTAENLEVVARVATWIDPPLDAILLSELNPRIEETHLERDARPARVTLWTCPHSTEWVLQLHARANDPASRVRAYTVAFRRVTSLYYDFIESADWLDFEGRQTELFDRQARELIVKALALISSVTNAIDWEWEGVYDLPLAGFGPRAEARKYLTSIARRSRGLPEAFRAELEGKRLVLRHRPKDVACIAIGRMKAYTPDGRQQIAELDGVVVEISRGDSVSVTLVEVKDRQKRSRSAVVKDLAEKVARLTGITIARNMVTVRYERGVTAGWVTLEIDRSGARRVRRVIAVRRRLSPERV